MADLNRLYSELPKLSDVAPRKRTSALVAISIVGSIVSLAGIYSIAAIVADALVPITADRRYAVFLIAVLASFLAFGVLIYFAFAGRYAQEERLANLYREYASLYTKPKIPRWRVLGRQNQASVTQRSDLAVDPFTFTVVVDQTTESGDPDRPHVTRIRPNDEAAVADFERRLREVFAD